jgi:hypothetical protein
MEIFVRPRLKVSFENEDTRKDFSQKFKETWETMITESFLGLPEGTWELFKSEGHSIASILGSIPVDEDGEFYMKPKSGLCRERFIEKVGPQLIRHIQQRIADIFGEDDMGGSFAEYRWLQKHYGITEEEDNIWLDLLYHHQGTLTQTESFQDLEEIEQKAILEFVNDREKAITFLLELSKKYDSVRKKYLKAKNKK